MNDSDNGALHRVLIAVSDPRVRSALRAFLGANPKVDAIVEADGLTSAPTLILKNAPTVAIVDICLPTRNDDLALIRRLTRDFEIPVVSIGMTGGASRSALQAGAIRFLDKARVADDLFDALQAISQCSAHRGQAVPPQRVSASRLASAALTETTTASP